MFQFRIPDMGDYLVLRPVTSLGTAKANTFIDVPADPDLLEHIGRHLMVAAGRIRRERCDACLSSGDWNNAQRSGSITSH